MPPKTFTEHLTPTLKLEMILVEGGKMHIQGKLEKIPPFYMGKYPVTQKQWQGIMETTPSHFEGPLRPVETVSWHDVQAFINKLSVLTLRTYRLPTEAEWEYAARGGKYSEGCEYGGSNDLKDTGWYNVNSHFETKKVGIKTSNELGIHDMSGNVREWSQDDHGYEYVVRGGGWDSDLSLCFPSYKSEYDGKFKGSDLGFRLAFSGE